MEGSYMGKIDPAQVEKTLSMLLSKQYGADVQFRFIPKSETQAQEESESARTG